MLGLDTTRGDRLFITLLGSAFIFLGWLGLVPFVYGVTMIFSEPGTLPTFGLFDSSPEGGAHVLERFGAVILGFMGGCLWGFASGKDRVAGEELHTSFTLDRGGDYLALVAPDGVTVVSEIPGGYPEQFVGISYGLGTVAIDRREVQRGGHLGGGIVVFADGVFAPIGGNLAMQKRKERTPLDDVAGRFRAV